jgi:hypothetical protein
MIRWIRNYALVQLIILRQMGRQREPTKCWRICFEPALFSIVPAGINLPYSEFSYNNSYQASLKKSPFEALYGRKCRTPLYWDQIGERQVFGPDIVEEAEQLVQQVRENLRVAQTRQKSYADVRREI